MGLAFAGGVSQSNVIPCFRYFPVAWDGKWTCGAQMLYERGYSALNDASDK